MNKDELTTFNKALGLPEYEAPKIDMLIKTEDTELARELLNLEIKGVEITMAVKQHAGIVQDIFIVIKDSAAFLAVVRFFLDFMKSNQNKKPRNTKTVIYKHERSLRIEEATAEYRESVNFEIKEEKND